VISCFKARLLCMRLGTGHPGATLVSPHTVRRVALSQANIWSSAVRRKMGVRFHHEVAQWCSNQNDKQVLIAGQRVRKCFNLLLTVLDMLLGAFSRAHAS
jgi:hypothetical protein